MRLQRYAVLLWFVFAAGFPHSSLLAYGKKKVCPVTKAPDRPFVPPLPYSSDRGDHEFLFGSPGLWTVIYPNWHIHSGGKLPFFRQGYDQMKELAPRLTVVARQLDGKTPLVWNGWANNAAIPDRGMAGMFMVTGIDIPASGCWEIAAHYLTSRNNIQNLTYTVWVEP